MRVSSQRADCLLTSPKMLIPRWMLGHLRGCNRSSSCHSHVSRVFLVLKSGTDKWRLVLDFQWLNILCVWSKCKMETLEKRRHLARKNHDMTSFEDG